jgi:hypothetical protein
VATSPNTSGVARCPSCGADASTHFHSVAQTPVTCASIFDTAHEARAVPSGRVDLFLCGDCGLIFNPNFDAALAEVGARYEGSQAASAHFSQFARSLASAWIERHALRGKPVLEIGCGNGEFLRLMLAAGVGRGVGLDPVASASGEAVAGLQIEARRFDESTLDIEADAAVCRHTLEHVPDVSRFLGLLAQWARRGSERVVLFEVPATERVLSECAFWDVYYEHCNYFTEASLARAFELAGFEVRRMERLYGDQYLVLEAVVRPEATSAGTASPADALRADCLRFGADARQAIERCNRGLELLAASGRPVVLWQGASKTVGFLSALDAAAVVHSAVDLSAARHGKFLPGSGLAVHAPEELKRISPAYVVLMNPVYVNEVQAMLDELGVAARLLTVNELCAGAVERASAEHTRAS